MSEADGLPDAGQTQPPRGVTGVAALLRRAAEAEDGGDTGKGEDDKGTGDQVETPNADELLADPEPGGDADPNRGAKGPSSLAELAESAGLTTEQIFELQVPMPDGAEPIKLGQLKDSAAEFATLGEQTTELDDRRQDFENEMIRARQELTEVIQLLPEVPPELIAQAKAKHTAHLDAERQALLGVKPEWADPKVYAAAQDEILEAVADYGFHRADLDLVLDHRLTKLLHDFAGMKARIGRANAAMKEVRKQAKKPGADRRTPAKGASNADSPVLDADKTAAKAGDKKAQGRAVLALLGNSK